VDPLTTRLTRAAVWTGGNTLMVREVPIPELGDGDVLVRVDLATVCGSDLHTVSGRRAGACPSVLGHEAVGTVVDTGPHAPAGVGDRIIWSVTVGCGQCPRCLGGRSAKCLSVRKVGHESFDGAWPLSGAYAEHIVVPAGAAIAVVPPHIPDAAAAPAACATATVMATLEAAGDVAGLRVLVVGAGMLGTAAVGAYTDAGAAVRISDPDPVRVEVARAFGATPDDGREVDVAVDFSGSAPAIGAALARLDIGGRLVLAGSVAPGPPVPVDPERVVRGWLTVTGVHNYEPRHLRQAVAMLDRYRYPWASLVAPPVPLADIATVFSRPAVGLLRMSVKP
jgi:putative phosphonate catabolism associated alcohol dehydrogenase